MVRGKWTQEHLGHFFPTAFYIYLCDNSFFVSSMISFSSGASSYNFLTMPDPYIQLSCVYLLDVPLTFQIKHPRTDLTIFFGNLLLPHHYFYYTALGIWESFQNPPFILFSTPKWTPKTIHAVPMKYSTNSQFLFTICIDYFIPLFSP